MKHIAAIEAGKPLIKPDPKPQPDAATVSSLFPPVPEPVSAPKDASDFPPVPSDHPGFDPNNPSFVPSDKSVRSKQASAQARADFARHQQQEFGDFLRWMERIEQAKSPADLEDFLMREMAKQLQGGQSEFTPDRLIRAFETVNRHGETAGMSQLQQLDPDIAKAMSRHPQSKRVPPRTAPVRPKTVHNPK